MWMYWILFCVPAAASLFPARFDQLSRNILIAITAIALIVIIGLRDHVGADWTGYTNLIYANSILSIGDNLLQRDPGFGLLIWISNSLDWGVYGLDFFCACIFIPGLIVFCRRQPNFWLALALATPVLIVQVAMGAMRESIAIGILLFAFNAFNEHRIVRYIALVLLATSFHTSAILMLAIAPFMRGSLTNLYSIGFAAIFFAAAFAYIARNPDYDVTRYAELNPESSGALPRLAFTFAAAVIFLFVRRRWNTLYDDGALYLMLSLGALLITPLVFVFPSAVDRLDQYLTPLQIAVFTRLTTFLDVRLKTIVPVGVYALYAFAFAVWMNFSWIAKLAWLPSRSVLFQQS